MNGYVTKSLELHLFFGRIMKEHALFLRAGFTPAAHTFSAKAELFLKEFEDILSEAVSLSDGRVRRKVLNSGEVITEFTASAERQTQCLTGIPIDLEITEKTKCLQPIDRRSEQGGHLRSTVRNLNQKALRQLCELIEFKESILRCVQSGDLFTANYPLLIEHILREARLYRKYVEMLEREGDLPDRVVKDTECFWNQIMMEHAQFIRGLLDPCEEDLINAAEGFAEEYCRLLKAGRHAHSRTMQSDALAQTEKFRDFKAAGTRGIQENQIRSIILPLLADHVLREANHYIRLLEG